MSAAEEVRRAYAAAGWRLWRCPGYASMGDPVTWYYATTARGRYGVAETLFADSPLGVIRKVLAHPTMTLA